MSSESPQASTSTLKKLAAVFGGLLSAVYLSNIGLGFVELIPDNIPVAGNLDELVASLILLRCLMVLGLDPISIKQLALRHVAGQAKQRNTVDVEAEVMPDPSKSKD